MTFKLRQAVLILLLWLLPITFIMSQTLKLGQVNFPNSGALAAQEAFLDGLAALHCFWYPKALAKFQEAQRIDPQFALAYWGEAMTYNHPVWHQQDLAKGRLALKKITARFPPNLLKDKTEIETAFISSLYLLYGSGEEAERNDQYQSAMQKIYQKYPNNIEVVSFYALSILGSVNAYEGDFNKQLNAAHVLESYLSKGNQACLSHPGLLHYLIHAYDSPKYAKRAVKYANLYSKNSPDSSHALHMPAHIFLQLGMWDRVALQNEEAYQASLKWAKQDDFEELDFHARYWQLFAYLQQGRIKEARDILQDMKRLIQTDSHRQAQSYYDLMRMHYAVEANDWRDILRDHASPDDVVSKSHAACGSSSVAVYTKISTLLVEGMSAVESGDISLAEKTLASADALKLQYVHAHDKFNSKIIDIEKLSIQGLLLIKQDNPKLGLAQLRKAAEQEQLLDLPSGPPIPVKPASELFGEALLKQGQAGEALVWFKKSLQRTPNRTHSLLGAYQSSKKLGHKNESNKYLKQIELTLAHADNRNLDFP